MPQVPGSPYEPYVGVEPAERVLRVGETPVIPGAYGTGVGQAAALFGANVETAGNKIFEAALNYRKQQNEMGARDAANDWYNNTASPQQEKFLGTQGPGASADAAHAHLVDLDTGRRAARDQVLKQYGTSGASQFDADTASYMRMFGREALSHAVSETNKAREASYKNSSEVSNSAVYSSPMSEEVYQTQRVAALKGEVDFAKNPDGTNKFDNDVIEQNQKDAVNRLAVNRVMGLARADTNGTGVAFDVLRQLERNGDLSNPRDIQDAEKAVRTRYDAASQAAIASKEQNLIDEVRATGDVSPRARQIQGDIDRLRSRRVTLGETQEVSDRNSEELQVKVNAAKAEYRVSGELRGSSPFQGMIDTAAGRHGLNPTIFARQLHQESGLNPNVSDSSAGAQGIAQFIPETARQYNVNVRDPASSIEGAAHYMEDLTRQFNGNTGLALAAYNAGPAKVSAWLAGTATLPKETRDYVKSITGQSVNDWRVGEQPDIASLKVPPGAAGSVQRAAALVDQMRTDPSVTPSQRDANAAAGERVIQKFTEDNIRLANAGAVKQKQIDDKFLSDLMKDRASENPQITETMIKQMPDETQGGPSFTAKTTALKYLSVEGLPGPSDRESHVNAMNLFRRINLPEGDPNKITDRRTLVDAVGTQINRTDYNWIENQFDNLRSPQGESFAKLRAEFSKTVNKYLDTSSLIKIDGEGALRAYNFERFADSVIDQWRAAGKGDQVFQLLTPGPHFLGNKEILDNFDASAEDQINEVNRRLSPPKAPPAPAAPTVPAGIGSPRRPNESMDDYDRRVLGIKN